jgi:hypothetical protein
VHPGQAGHPPQDRVVRTGHPGQQLGHGQADRHQNAVQDVEDQHPVERHRRQQQLTAAERREPPEPGHVD